MGFPLINVTSTDFYILNPTADDNIEFKWFKKMLAKLKSEKLFYRSVFDKI